MKRACYVVRFIFADRYDIRNAYYNNYGRVALMGVSEVATSIPEHRFLGLWWNIHASRLGATPQAPVSTGGEENALCLNDRYRVEEIVLHEISHGLHLLGVNYVIRGFDGSLRSLYNRWETKKPLQQYAHSMKMGEHLFSHNRQGILCMCANLLHFLKLYTQHLPPLTTHTFTILIDASLIYEEKPSYFELLQYED